MPFIHLSASLYFVYLSVFLHPFRSVAASSYRTTAESRAPIMVYLPSFCTTMISCSSAFVLRGFKFPVFVCWTNVEWCFVRRFVPISRLNFISTQSNQVLTVLLKYFWRCSSIWTFCRFLLFFFQLHWVRYSAFFLMCWIELLTFFTRAQQTRDLRSFNHFRSIHFCNDWRTLMKRAQHWRIEAIKHFIELTDKNLHRNEKESRSFNRHKVKKNERILCTWLRPSSQFVWN